MPDPLVTASLDSWTPVVGAAQVLSNAPSSVANRHAAITTGGTIQTKMQTGRTNGGALILLIKNITTTGKTWWMLRSTGGVGVIRLQTVSGTQSQVQRWDGATWQAIGASFNTETVAWVNWRVDFTGLGTATGTITWSAETDGAGVVIGGGTTGVIDLSAIPNVAQIEADFSTGGGGFHRVATSVIQDSTAISIYAYATAPDADGTDSTGATGSYTDIDDVTTGLPDVDVISLAATGDRKTVKNVFARNYAGRTVAGVGFPYRASCGGTGPQSARPYLKIGGVRYYAATQALTTSKDNYFAWWTLDPSTGLPWATADAEDDALEYGLEAAA